MREKRKILVLLIIIISQIGCKAQELYNGNVDNVFIVKCHTDRRTLMVGYSFKILPEKFFLENRSFYYDRNNKVYVNFKKVEENDINILKKGISEKNRIVETLIKESDEGLYYIEVNGTKLLYHPDFKNQNQILFFYKGELKQALFFYYRDNKYDMIEFAYDTKFAKKNTLYNIKDEDDNLNNFIKDLFRF